MSSTNFSKTKVQKFLSYYKCDKIVDDRNDREIWMAPDGVTLIQLPRTGSIPWEAFQTIATEQLQLSAWEFDYWIGQNC